MAQSAAESAARPALSIIVPMLDEAAGLPRFLDELREILGAGEEVLFVDGGSSDASVALVRAAGFTVCETPRGRALQMNAGAAQASAQALLFLHADTRLPLGFASAVQGALAQGACWGRFDIDLVGRSPLLGVVAAFMNLRSRLTGIATGDQAIFVRRETFAALGGYPEQPLMEDVELSRRLRRLSAPACLRLKVASSGRRWDERGAWRTICLMWRLRWSYWRGVSAEELARRYS